MKEFAKQSNIMSDQASSKIKICYLADAGSIHTQRWCKHFSQRGFEVHLISFRNSVIEGATVHFIDCGKIDVSGGNWKVVLKVPTIRRILKKIKPDILHSHYATSYGLAGALCGFHPYVISAQGTDVLISPFQNAIYRFVVKYALRKADWITAMADHMRDTMIKLGINKEKINTIIFGIDPLVFNDNSRTLDTEKFVVTSTRNLEKVYNIPDIIDAISISRNSIPGLMLNIIGSGTMADEIKKKITGLQLQDMIKIHGKVSQTEMVNILRHSHVFVSVSSSDGNNISLNEAMACGCFSVVTDIPANLQWVSDGVNGFLVPVNEPQILANKIIEAFQNYNKLTAGCDQYNKKILKEKGNWNENMAVVEKKYLSLLNK
jgi:glycosyltransferase involved in cell wall biosynthesis